MSQSTQSAKRAWKVKCSGDGTPPCGNCRQSNLWCTYNAIPKKKGPKGSRAKVISGLREIQSLSPPEPGLDLWSLTLAPNRIPTAPILLLPELIDSCVDFFFAHLYPTQPILDRSMLRASINNMQQSVEDYCLVTSLCAYMLIQPSMCLHLKASSDANEGGLRSTENINRGKILLGETHRARRYSDYISNPTVNSIITAFFLFGSDFCLELPSAYFYLREATTLALLLSMDKEESYVGEDFVISNLKRRLFWLLFVTERAYALQMQKPLSLHNTIALPLISSAPQNESELTGFIHLVNLFKPFDDTFVGLWNQNIDGCTAEWIEILQSQLSEVLPTYLRSTEIQAVDLKISQQWLRTMIWQLSITNRLLSSSATTESMLFTYPLTISRALIMEANRFSQSTMNVHGIGLTKKIFDVACTLVDVMSIVPMKSCTFNTSPRDFLNNIFKIMSGLCGGTEKLLDLSFLRTILTSHWFISYFRKYIPLLLGKIEDTLPRLPGGSILHGIPPSLIAPDDNAIKHTLSTTRKVLDGSPPSSYERFSPNSTLFTSKETLIPGTSQSHYVPSHKPKTTGNTETFS